MPHYRILVEGKLDPSSADWFGGLAMAVRIEPSHPPVTELTGSLQDQAALQGVLDTLFMFRIPVLRVERTQQPEPI